MDDFSFEDNFASEENWDDVYRDDSKFMELKDKIKIYLEIAALTELVEEDLWENFTQLEDYILTGDEENEPIEEGDEEEVLNTLTEFLLPFYSGE